MSQDSKQSEMMRVGKEFAELIRGICKRYNNDIRHDISKTNNVPLKKIHKLTYKDITNEIYKKVKFRAQFWFWK